MKSNNIFICPSENKCPRPRFTVWQVVTGLSGVVVCSTLNVEQEAEGRGDFKSCLLSIMLKVKSMGARTSPPSQGGIYPH